jgi:hypothetical protein
LTLQVSDDVRKDPVSQLAFDNLQRVDQKQQRSIPPDDLPRVAAIRV